MSGAARIERKQELSEAQELVFQKRGSTPRIPTNGHTAIYNDKRTCRSTAERKDTADGFKTALSPIIHLNIKQYGKEKC
nr:MAG TPA: hypothetical protein [Caudoviricetes sp.]